MALGDERCVPRQTVLFVEPTPGPGPGPTLYDVSTSGRNVADTHHRPL